MSASTVGTTGHTSVRDGQGDQPTVGEFDLDIRVFESGADLDEIIRMTDDGCGATCESACTSC